MPGVTATWVCFPCAPTTVTSLAPDAVLTMAATGTVSTGPSVCPVSTVTRTFSPVSAALSGLDGCTASGMNADALEPSEDPEDPEEPDDPDDPVDPEPADPEEPAEPEPPPMATIAPVGTVVVGVPRSATVPVARMPVTSS